jgi:methyl-accepting chemotaxis protein
VEKVNAGAKLVGDAGTTMEDIVQAVGRVTGIMAQISAASIEQSAGIAQVNEAVAQMDKVTQQNAALVEQAAAAAESMEDQARGLSKTVSVFRLSESAVAAAPAPATPRVQPKASPGGKAVATRPASPSRKAPIAASSSEEWEEF